MKIFNIAHFQYFKRSLVFLLVLTLCHFQPLLHAETTFKDVNPTDWYYDSLQVLKNLQVVSGYTDGSFRSTTSLTKDQVIKMLVVAKNGLITTKATYWAQPYLDFSQNAKWLTGLNVTQPTLSISRYETCQLLVNALPEDSKSATENTSYEKYLKDYSQMPSNYQAAVLTAYRLGLIGGYPDGTFKGNNTLTRAEAVVMLHRYIDAKMRIIPLNTADITTLSAIFQNPSTMINYSDLKNTVSFSGTQLLFTDETKQNKTLYQTRLPKTIAGQLEHLLIQSLDYMSTQHRTSPSTSAGYTLYSGYSHSTFTLSIYDPTDTMQLQWLSTPEQKSLSLTLNDLYQADQSPNPYLFNLLKNQCRILDDTDTLYNYLYNQYLKSDLTIHTTISEKVGNYQVTIEPERFDGFVITLVSLL